MFFILSFIKLFLLPKPQPTPKNLSSGNFVTLASPQDLTLTAVSKNDSGISPQSTFILKSQQPLDTSVLSETLKIFPEIPFSVEAKNNRQWLITLKNPMVKGKIYRFTIPSLVGSVQAQELTWAFQVETPLQIIGSFPANKATAVPLNSSIEIYLNQLEFNFNQSAFSIDPSVPGRFEIHQTAVVFIPEKLQPQTLYTVTLKSGTSLKDKSQVIDKDFTFQFETSSENKESLKRFEFTRTLIETSPDKQPVILLESWNSPSSSAKLRVYRLNSSDFSACLEKQIKIPTWARFSYTYHRCPTSASPIIDTDIPINRPSENYSQSYVDVPQKLEAGFYLVELDNPDSPPSQAMLQITPISWYSWYGSRESLLWLNHTISKTKLAGVSVSINNQLLGLSDNQGLLKFSTPETINKLTPTILTLKTQSDTAFGLIDFHNQWYSDSLSRVNAAKYWSYLYFDRQLYQPTDKIQFWGIAKGRQNNLPKIKVKLLPEMFNFWDPQPFSTASIYEKEISLSSDGTFKDSFDLQDFSPGYYSVGIFDGETFIGQKSFNVEAYFKPAFQISAVPDKVAIFASQKNQIRLNAKYYDGTPLSQAVLTWSYYYDNKSKSGEITTDSSGHATLDIPTAYNESNYWPKSVSVNIRPKIDQETAISTDAYFLVFGPKIDLTSKTTWKNNQALVAITATKINIDQRQTKPWEKNEPLPNAKVSISVDRVWYESIEDGDTYDPINKINRKKYRYERRSENTSQGEVTTDSQGQAGYNFAAANNNQYEINLNSVDDEGKTEKLQDFLYAGSNSYQEGFTISVDKEKYKTNETISLSLTDNGQPSPQESPNQYLILSFQNGQIFDVVIQSQNQHQLQFKPEFIPNFYIKSAWFDGNTYRLSQNFKHFSGGDALGIFYDIDEKKLEISATPDKTKYAPGENVSLKISVKNRQNQPEKAKVLISVVDDAMSYLQGTNSPDILSNLYAPLPEGVVFSFSSHPSPQMSNAAEGGGGGDGFRDNLVDTASFSQVETDSNGTASLTFKVPDNITSWRLSTIAITSNLLAGDNQTVFPVSKPIFVNVISVNDFLTSDKPLIQAIAYGDAITPGTNVKYTFKIPSLGVNSEEITKPAFTPVQFQLPPLKAGSHRLEVWAQVGSQKDGIPRILNVSDTRLVQEKTDLVNLDNEYKTNLTSALPIKALVIDRSRASYLSYLEDSSDLNYYGKNERIDRLAAQSLAKTLLNQYFASDYSVDENFGNYLREGYALLPQGTVDPVLSAKIAATKLPSVDKNSLKNYFQKVITTEKSIEIVSAAYWGLAEINEPILSSIQSLSDQKNTPLGKIYLGLAASALGDHQTADKILKTLKFKNEKPYIYCQISSDKNDNITASALSLILAARAGDLDLFNGLYRYLNSNRSQENLHLLEPIISLSSSLKQIPNKEAIFEYQLDGKTTTQKLENHVFSLTILPSQLSQFKIKPVSGQLSLSLRWWQKLDPNFKQNPDLKLSLNAKPVTLSGTKLYEITLIPHISQTLNGSYLISVNLPSGLKFLDSVYSLLPQNETNSNLSWPIFTNSNHLVFSTYTGSTFRFYAKAVNQGTFTFEPGSIYHSQAADNISLSDKPEDVVISN